MSGAAAPLVLGPALLCGDALYGDALYGDALRALGDRAEARVTVAGHPSAAASVAEIRAQAPPRFVLGGACYGGTIAIDVALAAPGRAPVRRAPAHPPAISRSKRGFPRSGANVGSMRSHAGDR